MPHLIERTCVADCFNTCRVRKRKPLFPEGPVGPTFHAEDVLVDLGLRYKTNTVAICLHILHLAICRFFNLAGSIFFHLFPLGLYCLMGTMEDY